MDIENTFSNVTIYKTFVKENGNLMFVTDKGIFSISSRRILNENDTDFNYNGARDYLVIEHTRNEFGTDRILLEQR